MILPDFCSCITQPIAENSARTFSSLVSLLIESKLQDKFGTCRTLSREKLYHLYFSYSNHRSVRTVSYKNSGFVMTRSVGVKQRGVTCHVIGSTRIEYPKRLIIRFKSNVEGSTLSG
ncbi:hypothetical protein V6Z12_D10G170000 [Gossypium hirsutum]